MRGNFFDRLAARTLGVAPVSQPILPTLFSPVASFGAMESATAPPSEGVETPTSSFSPGPARENAPSRSFPGCGGSAEAGQDSDAVRRETVTRDLTLPKIDGALPRETAAIPPKVETLVPPPAELEPAPRGMLTVPGAVDVSAKVREETSQARLALQPLIARVAVRGATESSLRDSVHARVAERTRKTSSQSAAEPAAPLVRVTIGRVEVRAQFPAAPSAPAPRRSRASTLSLEDYLKQRSGGKR